MPKCYNTRHSRSPVNLRSPAELLRTLHITTRERVIKVRLALSWEEGVDCGYFRNMRDKTSLLHKNIILVTLAGIITNSRTLFAYSSKFYCFYHKRLDLSWSLYIQETQTQIFGNDWLRKKISGLGSLLGKNGGRSDRRFTVRITMEK